MKKILSFLFLCSLAFGQAPNLFYTYLTTGVNSTDTTFYFTATDSTFAGSGTLYFATIWDTWYSTSADAYKAGRAEIILVNSRSGRTFDVERGQLGTTAKSFNTSGRRYKIEASFYDTLRGFTLYGIDLTETAALTDSVANHRTFINANRDSINAHRTFINANRDSVHKLTDSIASHRTFINANRDSIHSHTDSIYAHRTILNAYLSDSVDVPLAPYYQSAGATVNPGATAYAAPGLWQTSPASDTYQAPLPACKLVGLYVRSTANGADNGVVVTAMKNGSPTGMTVSLADNVLTGENTSSSVAFSAGEKLSYKIVLGAGGTGITNISIYAIIRTK